MFKNLLTVSGWTMLSRLLGLVRDQLLAAFLGAGSLQDAYQVAFRLPNMFRRLFGEGAFNAAFVPLFTLTLDKKNINEAKKFANESFNILIFILLIFTLLGEIFMPQLLHIIAPGFTTDKNRYHEAIILSRITFPYMILICGAALLAGVLNSLHHFSIAAAAYVSFNIFGIAALLWLTPFMPNAAWAAAWGVTISGVAQFGILWLAARKAGITILFHRPKLSPSIKKLFRKMTPGIIGSGITQINLTIDTIIATLLPTGSVSVMYFADRINQLPLGVLGAAAGTTLLPLLTKELNTGNKEAALSIQNKTLDYCLLLTLPAAFGLFTLAPLIISTLFGHGAFNLDAVCKSAQSLRTYTVGLPAFILIKVLSPGFFARGDTSTPVKIGIFTLLLNFILNLIFMYPLAHMGPPLASSIAAIANVGALAFILWKKDAFYLPVSIIKRIIYMIVAAFIMSLSIFLTEMIFFQNIIKNPILFRIIDLSILVLTGGLVYGGILHILDIIDLNSTCLKVRQRILKR